MKPLLIAVLAAIASLVSAPAAQAIMVQVDLFIPDDRLLTRDTDTGLEWLDVNATAGSSIVEILADINGYLARGFRRASLPEVCGLLSHAGGGACVLASSSGSTDPTDPVLTIELINFLGPIEGSTTEAATVAGLFEQGFARLFTGPVATGRNIRVQGNDSDRDEYGHFLVREATGVPEPSQTLLVLLSFAAACWIARTTSAR